MNPNPKADLECYFGEVMSLTRKQHEWNGHRGLVAQCRTRNTGTATFWMVPQDKAREYIHLPAKEGRRIFREDRT